MKIIALNLPRNITNDELSELFKTYGKVESCQLVMNKDKGTSKGFGFVEMEDIAAAEAIKNLHGKKIGENKIRVKASDIRNESQ
jgi:RNA recognition motif-containing protein